MPPDLSIDGDAREYKVTGRAGPKGSVVVALDDKKLVFAITRADASKGALAIALTSYAPFFPDVGWTQRGGTTFGLTDEGCRFEQHLVGETAEGEWKSGAPRPPEVVAACRAVLKRHATMAAKYDERFVRRFRISATAVEALDKEGRAKAIEGAKHRAAGQTIEVMLPLAAMPAFAAAPLAKMLLFAAEGDLSADIGAYRGPESGYSEVPLASPVSFSPHAQLRDALFGRHIPKPHHEMSYHPAEPQKIDVVYPAAGVSFGGANTPDRMVVVESSQPIFTKTDDLGEVVVGIARGTTRFLATLRKGKLVGLEPFPDVRGVKKRGQDLHFFGYESAGFFEALSERVSPYWRAFAVKPDGTLHLLSDEEGYPTGAGVYWDTPPVPFSDRGFTTFGVRGRSLGVPKTVTWRWNEKETKYLSSVIPAE